MDMRLLPALLVLAPAAVLATCPSYGPQVILWAGGSQVDVGYYAAPCVTDWDGDGVQDLILGVFSYGNIRFYGNSSTNDSPVFTTFENIKADGSPITLPYG
jgi:hypothetical protein